MNSQLKQYFSKKPIGQNVSPIKKLKDFIDRYPNEQLHDQLRKLQSKYHYYRAIKGDGDCFYRACMFLYLRDVQIDSFQRIFKNVPIICTNLPFDFEDFDPQEILKAIWMHYILPLKNLSSEEKEEKLQQYFNTSALFDAVLISYFRSLNYHYINSHRKKFESFTSGGIEKQLSKIKKFHEQSEGVELYSLSQLLGAKMTIMMTDVSIVKAVEYMKQGSYEFTLFYRPGHYDILYKDIVRKEDKTSFKLPTYSQSTQKIQKSVSSIIEIRKKSEQLKNKSVKPKKQNNKQEIDIFEFVSKQDDKKSKELTNSSIKQNKTQILPANKKIQAKLEHLEDSQSSPFRIAIQLVVFFAVLVLISSLYRTYKN